MSKLYHFYQLTKMKHPDKVILIKSGTFYVILEKDAILVNDLLGLKLTPLNENIVKCGFPIISLPKYEKMLQSNYIDYFVTELNENYSQLKSYEKKVIEEIQLLDLNQITPMAAFNLLAKYQEQLKKVYILVYVS